MPDPSALQYPGAYKTQFKTTKSHEKSVLDRPPPTVPWSASRVAASIVLRLTCCTTECFAHSTLPEASIET